VADLTGALGLVGAIAFAVSGIPQAIRSVRLGTSRGMSGLTILLWVTGEIAMLAYALLRYSDDMVLIGNYSASLLTVAIIAWYYLFPRPCEK
jgi:uncharacterized protein with PQ loop repeat